jgi:hypothetical protein
LLGVALVALIANIRRRRDVIVARLHADEAERVRRLLAEEEPS